MPTATPSPGRWLTPAAHGTAVASGTGTSKAIGYTPATGYTGKDSFVVQAADGNGGADTILVTVNDPRYGYNIVTSRLWAATTGPFRQGCPRSRCWWSGGGGGGGNGYCSGSGGGGMYYTDSYAVTPGANVTSRSAPGSRRHQHLWRHRRHIRFGSALLAYGGSAGQGYTDGGDQGGYSLMAVTTIVPGNPGMHYSPMDGNWCSGGGAGHAGYKGDGQPGGHRLQCAITGTNTYYAGGGGAPGSPGLGGLGGGGNWRKFRPLCKGTDGLGGGAGGSWGVRRRHRWRRRFRRGDRRLP